jgi:glycerophosphoryl diester phosphodiesterase
VQVLGHRGARLVAPENTIEAFRAALDQGADGVELDVRQTADGALVCFHDAALGRTTDGRGLLREHTLAEVASLDAGAWPRLAWGRLDEGSMGGGPAQPGGGGPAWPAARRFRGVRVPTLAEALDALPPGALVDVEVKARGEGPQGPKDVAAALAAVLAGRGDSGRVMVSSFSRRVAAAAAAELPGIRTGLVSPSLVPLGRALRAAEGIGCSVLAAHVTAFLGPKARVAARRARDEGILLLAWTVDDPQTAHRLSDLGVAVVVSDHPGRLVRSLRG